MSARNAAKKSTPRKAPGRREGKAATTPPSGSTTTVTTGQQPGQPAPKGGNYVEEFKKYLKAVQAEFNRVTWPGNTNSFTKSMASPEMKAATMVVLITLVMFSLYLGFLDVAFTRIFKWGGH